MLSVVSRHDPLVTNDRPMNEAIDAYVALFDSEWGWDAACWTVIQSEYSGDQLLSRLSNDHEVLAPVDLDRLRELAYERDPGAPSDGWDAMGWLVKTGDSVGILEVNGFAGSQAETLSALTTGSPALAMSTYWNAAIGRVSLSYALSGEVERVDLVGEDYDHVTSPALKAALGALAGDAPQEAKGMAVIERLSGVRLDEIVLSQEWPVIRFQMRQTPLPAMPSTAMLGDPAFALALMNASPPVRRAAQTRLLAEVLDATGLADEPAATACAAQFSEGETPEVSGALFQLLQELQEGYEVPSRGKVNLTDPGWLRLQAGNVLFALCNPRDDDERDPRRFQSWLSASYALGDQWPTARTRYLSLLHRPDP